MRLSEAAGYSSLRDGENPGKRKCSMRFTANSDPNTMTSFDSISNVTFLSHCLSKSLVSVGGNSISLNRNANELACGNASPQACTHRISTYNESACNLCTRCPHGSPEAQISFVLSLSHF